MSRADDTPGVREDLRNSWQSETGQMQVTARVALSPIYAVLIAKNSQVTVDHPHRKPGQEAIIQVASRGLAGRPMPESRLALEVISPAGQVVMDALLTADHFGKSSFAIDTTTLLGTYQIRIWDITYGPRIRLESSISLNIEPYQPSENSPAADQAASLAVIAISTTSAPAPLAILVETGQPDWIVYSTASTQIEAQAFSPIRVRAGPG